MISFGAACKLQGPLIVEVDGIEGVPPVRRAFDGPSIIVGRGPRSDLRIEHPDVSVRHAYLQVIGGRLHGVDLDSRTGTQVIGGNSTGGWIAPGHPVRLGAVRIRVISPECDEAGVSIVPEDPLSTKLSHEVDGLKASLTSGAGASARSVRISRMLTLIGRSQRCRIRPAFPGASRFHCALLRTTAGVWVVDLHSTAGTSVNGVEVQSARLEDGDELRIGPLKMRVALADPPNLARRTSSPPVVVSSPLVASGSFPEGLDIRTLLDHVAGSPSRSDAQIGQAILLLTQLFGTMHRDMIELVREELAQIRRLADVIQSMRPESTGRLNHGEVGETARIGPPESAPSSGETTKTRDAVQIHFLVSERLAAFEEESRGRWNKISRMFNKNGSS